MQVGGPVPNHIARIHLLAVHNMPPVATATATTACYSASGSHILLLLLLLLVVVVLLVLCYHLCRYSDGGGGGRMEAYPGAFGHASRGFVQPREI